jgi:class 3 adenylate cyclase
MRRRHSVLLRFRAAAVRSELLEIAALLERARDPDPACVVALRELLANGDSPLYHPGIPAAQLLATLDYVRTGLVSDGIPGARFVNYTSDDHAFWLGAFDQPVDEIERFVTAGAVDRTEPDRVLASVLFTDIVASTACAAELGDRAWRELLERHDALVERVVSEHGGRVVKHIGDGALAAFDGPAMAMRCAEELNESVSEFGIRLRSGIHTGECEAIGEDLGGLAVHIGARVGALAEPGEIVVSSTVKELVVGSDLQFSDRGAHELKGVPGAWHLYALAAERTPQPQLDGAAGYMRRSDRVAVTLARRMPRAMRLAGQLAARRAMAA